MEISIRPIGGGSRFEFPSMPDKINVGNSVTQRSYSIISLGEVKIPSGTGCEIISWETIFYGESKKGEPMMGTYQSPLSCVKTLEDFRDRGTKLNLMASELGINRDVTIQSFSWTPYGGHGNIAYSIELVQAKNIEISESSNTISTAVQASEADTPLERPSAPPADTYTIVSGDTLCKIARKLCGGESRWIELYNANSGVIESAARSHGKKSSDKGHWIYPGTTITLV